MTQSAVEARDPRQAADETRFCASFARTSGESLLGKASFVQTYLLIEDPNAWSGPKDIESTALNPAALDRVTAFKAHCPGPRLLFIKNRTSRERAERSVYLVMPAPSGARMRHFVVPDLDAIGEIDFVAEAARLAGDPTAVPEAFPVLICTNGKKDMCCAKFGGPTYAALDALLPDVWECTHTGGDRFAGNVVLPVPGQFYGFVLADRAEAFAQTIRKRHIPIDHFRGASFLPAAVQAAEGALRIRLGASAMGRIVYAGNLPAPDDAASEPVAERPILLDWDTGEIWTVRARKIESDRDVPSNCTKGKTTQPWHMALDGWRCLGAEELQRLGLRLDGDLVDGHPVDRTSVALRRGRPTRLVRQARADDWPWLQANPEARRRLERLIGPAPATTKARGPWLERLEAARLPLWETREGARDLVKEPGLAAELSA